jgi:hypothetical protein
MLRVIFWVVSRRVVFNSRRFGTLCLFHLPRRVDMKWDYTQRINLMSVSCIIRRNRNDQQYALICNTALLYIPAATCFGCSLPLSGSFRIRLSYMKIQIDMMVCYTIWLRDLCAGVSWFRLLWPVCWSVVVPSVVFHSSAELGNTTDSQTTGTGKWSPWTPNNSPYKMKNIFLLWNELASLLIAGSELVLFF